VGGVKMQFDILHRRIRASLTLGEKLDTPAALAQLEADNRRMLEYLWADGYRTNEFSQLFLPSAGLGSNPLYGMNITGVSLADCSNWRALQDSIRDSECLTLNQIHAFQRTYNTSLDSRSYFVPIEYNRFNFSMEGSLWAPALSRQVEFWRAAGDPNWLTRFWTLVSHDLVDIAGRVRGLTHKEGLDAIARFQKAVADNPTDWWFSNILRAGPNGPALPYSLQTMEGYIQLLMAAPYMITGTWGPKGRQITIPSLPSRWALPTAVERLFRMVQIPQHVPLSDLLFIADATDWGLSLWVNWPGRLAIGVSYLVAQRKLNEFWQAAYFHRENTPLQLGKWLWYWTRRLSPQILRTTFTLGMIKAGALRHIAYSGWFASTRIVLDKVVKAVVKGPDTWWWPREWVMKGAIYGLGWFTYVGLGAAIGAARHGIPGGFLGGLKAIINTFLLYYIFGEDQSVVHKYIFVQALVEFVFKFLEEMIPRKDRELEYLVELMQQHLPASPIKIRKTPLIDLSAREDAGGDDELDTALAGAVEFDAAIFVTEFAQIRAYFDGQRIASHFKFSPPVLAAAQ